MLFYQNPKFYLTNSFKREIVGDELTNIENKITLHVITGVCNSHHKNHGKRQKICLIRSFNNGNGKKC